MNYDNQYCPLQCMIDLKSTSFVISPQAAKLYKIPVVRRMKIDKSANVTEREIITEGLFSFLLEMCFGN
jgi:hypothetical protein